MKAGAVLFLFANVGTSYGLHLRFMSHSIAKFLEMGKLQTLHYLNIINLTRAVNRLADAVQSVKEGKEEHSPQTPYKEKGKKPTTTTTRARARFVKPSVEEVAAYIRTKGYTFDAGRF